MQEPYDITLEWDPEAEVWMAINEAIPLALESESLDALMERVRIAVPELLELNGKSSGNIKLRFHAERLETVGV
jgi:hypothetical protein